MKRTVQWIALAAVVMVLYISDAMHVAASRFNLFLFILLAMVAVLVALIKITHDPSDPPG